MYEFINSDWVKTDEISLPKDNQDRLSFIKVNEDFNKVLLLQSTGKIAIYFYENNSFSKINQNYSQIYEIYSQQDMFPRNQQKFHISDDFNTIITSTYDQEMISKIDIFRLKNKTWKRFLDPLYSPNNSNIWGTYLSVSKDGTKFAAEEYNTNSVLINIYELSAN